MSGSYDLVLSDLATALGDESAAHRHALTALTLGVEVRSPWQESDAAERLEKLSGPAAVAGGAARL